LDLRAVVVNHRVVSDDIRHILRLVDDLHILSSWLDVPRVARGRPVRIPDKAVGRRSNVIIRIRPGRNRNLRRDIGFRRERSPPDMLVTFSPRDPSRGPLTARYPAPSSTADPDPSSIMVRCPAETLV
jgi:hypothetical protein